MAECDALSAELKPRLAEQESLEQELEQLRQERWTLERVTELENMKEGLLADVNHQAINDEAAAMEAANPFAMSPAAHKAESSQAAAASDPPAGEVDAANALQETLELERELDEELAKMANQLSEVKMQASSMHGMRDKLLQEMAEWANGGPALDDEFEEKNNQQYEKQRVTTAWADEEDKA